MKKFTVWIKKHKKLAVFLCIAIIIAANLKNRRRTHENATYDSRRRADDTA